MDAQETSLYQILVVAIVIFSGVQIFTFVLAIRRQALYHKAYKKDIEQALNNLEEEKTRIAADLHDDLGPILSAIKIKIEGIRAHNAEDEAQLQSCINHILQSTEKLRGIAQNLMPSVLISKGLVQAVEQFAEELKLNGLNTELIIDEIPELKKQPSIQIYRILQEIIHNTTKHAQASELVIEIGKADSRLRIFTADNGSGFNQKEVRQNNKGYGLNNMKRRVELLEGRLHLKTASGKGTRYSIEIPLFKIIKPAKPKLPGNGK